jgi:hypothetical protein
MEGTVAVSGAQMLLFIVGVLGVMGAMAKIILADKDRAILDCHAETLRIIKDAREQVEKIELDRNFWRDQWVNYQAGQGKQFETLIAVVGVIKEIVQKQEERDVRLGGEQWGGSAR